MSFLNDTATGRRLVSFGARLLVQSAMACATPQIGMDDWKSFHAPHRVTNELVARHEQEFTVPEFGHGLASLRQSGQRRRPG